MEGREDLVFSEQVQSPNKTYLFHLRSARASGGGGGGEALTLTCKVLETVSGTIATAEPALESMDAHIL